MPSPIIPLVSFLLLLIAGNSAAKFLEAPFFNNSPQCSTPFAHADGANNNGLYCRENVINIAMTLDEAYVRGSMAAVLSIIHHCSCPENLFFHFIYSQSNFDLRTIMASSFPYLHFQLYPFDEETVRGRISTSVRQALDCPLNYARSYLASLLPGCVRRVIYLDSDVILVDDIGKLWAVEFASNKSAIAAPEYCDANMSRYFTPSFWANPTLAATFENRRSEACYFNTGVMVVDLEKWRANDYTTAIEEWMELQKRMRIYELGSLPPFLLVFAGEVTAVAQKWNQHGLGGDNYEGHCRGLHPGDTSLLHWSGRGKPWVRLDAGRPCPVDALWAPYDMLRKPFATVDQ